MKTSKKSIWSLILCMVCYVNGLDFLTASLSSVGAGIAYQLYNNYYYCTNNECCTEDWIKNNFYLIEDTLNKQLYGQHIVRKVVFNALKGHLRNPELNKKALAMSFHGWTGNGKTFVSNIIGDGIYKKKHLSQYWKFYSGRIHFPVKAYADIYKVQLSDWIRGNVSECGNSMFIFDEVDKIPEGVLEVVKPFLEHSRHIFGIDFRKTIFIFLSNTGGTAITEKYIDMWKQGKQREDMTLQDFEGVIKNAAYNEKGGLQGTGAIESWLIDHYVPFLPLENSHVRKCILKEFSESYYKPTEEDVQTILDSIQFGPPELKLFSTSGCKTIYQKVAALREQKYYS